MGTYASCVIGNSSATFSPYSPGKPLVRPQAHPSSSLTAVGGWWYSSTNHYLWIWLISSVVNYLMQMTQVQVPVGPWTRPWRPLIPGTSKRWVICTWLPQKGSGPEEPGLDERWATGTMIRHSWTISSWNRVWKSLKVPSGSNGNWVLEVFGMSLNSFWHVQIFSNLSYFITSQSCEGFICAFSSFDVSFHQVAYFSF